MAKILVNLSDPSEQEEVCAALRLKRHDVTAESRLPKDGAREAAEAILAANVEVAVLDYLEEDAASVKLLQAATDSPKSPRFIFILPKGTSSAHILMAVNEGASALIERPINTDSLANYIERALNGPARFRFEMSRENTRSIEISEMEREARTMRTQLAAYRRLVSYLLSTPSSAQHRTALVVSDSAYQRDHLRKLLEDHGFLVHAVRSPDEGIETALAEKPRIIISDLEMEGMNGIQFCHELKNVRKYTPCHFVICTANADRIEEATAPGNGVDACVIKPSDESGNHRLIAVATMGLLL